MIIVGSLLLGIGIGMFVDNKGAGALVGLGAGFIIEYLLRSGGFRLGQNSSDDGTKPPHAD